MLPVGRLEADLVLAEIALERGDPDAPALVAAAVARANSLLEEGERGIPVASKELDETKPAVGVAAPLMTSLTLTLLTSTIRSMATAVEDLLARVAAAARRDPEGVRPVLQVLVGDEPQVGQGRLRPVASRLNDARLAAAHDEFRAGALTTDDVRRRLELGSRQAVHALRDRGRLVGRTFGNATLFPAWQFEGPGLRGDLSALLGALRRLTNDAVACDRVMRLPRPELGGTSLAESLDDPGRRPLAWALLDRLGEH